MKFYETTNILQYSWSQVAQALWLRYPNPESMHVLTEDTICRKVVGDKLYSKRIIFKTNHLPKWGERFVKAKNVGIIEESIVDPVNQKFSTYTRNIGLTKFMSCIEKVTYRPNPSNPSETLQEKRAWVDSNFFGLAFAIQKFGIDRYIKNGKRANKGFNVILNNYFGTPQEPLALKKHGEPKDHKSRLKDAARETAKRAKEIAQEKTRPIYTVCESAEN